MSRKMKMMIMQMEKCKENDFMSFYAKVDFLGQMFTFLLTFFLNFLMNGKETYFYIGQN
jgi:hypothetical protein